MGFFLPMCHRHIDLAMSFERISEKAHPESPPETKCWSSNIHTQSIEPSTNCARSAWCVSTKGSRRSKVRPPPRKTSWVSSSVFHHRQVRSLEPDVTAAVGFKADTHGIESWCPKKVSIVERVDKECKARCREREAEKNCRVGLLNGGMAIDCMCQ